MQCLLFTLFSLSCVAPVAVAAQKVQETEVVNPRAAKFLNSSECHNLVSVLASAGVIDAERAKQIKAARIVSTKALNSGEVDVATSPDGQRTIYVSEDDSGGIEWALMWLNTEEERQRLRKEELNELIYVTTASVIARMDLALYLNRPGAMRKLDSRLTRGVAHCVSVSLLNILHKRKWDVRDFVKKCQVLRPREAEENKRAVMYMESTGKYIARKVQHASFGYVYRMCYENYEKLTPLAETLKGKASSGMQKKVSLKEYGAFPGEIRIGRRSYELEELFTELPRLSGEQLNQLFMQEMSDGARQALMAGLGDYLCELLVEANPTLRLQIEAGHFSREELTRHMEVTFYESGELLSQDTDKRDASGNLPRVPMNYTYDKENRMLKLNVCVDVFREPAEYWLAKSAHEMMGHGLLKRYLHDDINVMTKVPADKLELYRRSRQLEEGFCVAVEAIVYKQQQMRNRKEKGIIRKADIDAYYKASYRDKYKGKPALEIYDKGYTLLKKGVRGTDSLLREKYKGIVDIDFTPQSIRKAFRALGN